jgi:hypothetical protein
MNTIDRIPDFADLTPDGMQYWFAEMSARDLIFHPEDAPREIQDAVTGERMFTDGECVKLEAILSTMFAAHGDGVIEAAYPVFMRKAGALHALDA